MYIDPFAALVALLPLIGYLLTLGVTRLLGYTIVTTGGRDIAAVGIAVAGMAAVGPAQLFFPNAAASLFGPKIWIALIAFYSLVVSLIALTTPPRLVIYGRTPAELLEPLLAAAQKIDDRAELEGKMLIRMPSKQLHFRIEGFRDIDHAQVIAFESDVPLRVWNQLLANLRFEVEQLAKPTPRRGHLMVIVAGVMAIGLLWMGVQYNEAVVQGFKDWIWR